MMNRVLIGAAARSIRLIAAKVALADDISASYHQDAAGSVFGSGGLFDGSPQARCIDAQFFSLACAPPSADIVVTDGAAAAVITFWLDVNLSGINDAEMTWLELERFDVEAQAAS
jgi:hypothetical protein